LIVAQSHDQRTVPPFTSLLPTLLDKQMSRPFVVPEAANNEAPNIVPAHCVSPALRCGLNAGGIRRVRWVLRPQFNSAARRIALRQARDRLCLVGLQKPDEPFRDPYQTSPSVSK
jgi:hypothetical protein